MPSFVPVINGKLRFHAKRICRKAGIVNQANTKPGRHLPPDHPQMIRVREWFSAADCPRPLQWSIGRKLWPDLVSVLLPFQTNAGPETKGIRWSSAQDIASACPPLHWAGAGKGVYGEHGRFHSGGAGREYREDSGRCGFLLSSRRIPHPSHSHKSILGWRDFGKRITFAADPIVLRSSNERKQNKDYIL